MEDQIKIRADRFPLIRDIGHHKVEGGYTHPDRTLDYDVFLYVNKGCMQVVEDNVEYIVRETEHLFLKHGLRHWGQPMASREPSWYWIHMNAESLPAPADFQAPPALPHLGFHYPAHYHYLIPLPKYGTSPLHSSLESRLRRMLDIHRQQQPHAMTEISAIAYQMFLDLGRGASNQADERQGDSSHYIARQVMDYLQLHSDQDFDSSKLASHMQLNYSYLSAAFKKHTGQTVIQAHTLLRMNKAIELVRADSSLTVAELSDRVGYSNPFYFSRVFKKTMGQAPSLYLKHYY